MNTGIKIHLPIKIERYVGILPSFEAILIVSDLSKSFITHEKKGTFYFIDLLNINFSKSITIQKGTALFYMYLTNDFETDKIIVKNHYS